MMNEKNNVTVIVNPLRITRGEGAFEYLTRVIKTINQPESQNNLLIIAPKGFALMHSADTIFFEPLGGFGIAIFEINPTFYTALLIVTRKLRNLKYNQIKVLHNFHFGAFGSLFLSKLLEGTFIYIAHDVEIDRYSQGSVSVSEQKLLPVLKFLSRFYEFFATRADIIVSISHKDKRRLCEIYHIPPDKIRVIYPTPRELQIRQLNIKKRRNILRVVFHGSYKYLPNREAMESIKCYISRKPWDKNVQFVVFGSGSPKFKEKNFSSLGFVDDVFEFLSSCDIAIVPLKRGAGVKLKVLDYMAVGLPIVTTKKGAEGLELVNYKHAIIVDDVNKDFIRAIEYLIENPKIRRKLGHNAKKLFQRQYSINTP